MKVKFFTCLLSFFLVYSPLHAVTNPPPIVLNPIDLNTVDAKALSKSMKGIGIKRAEAIVKYRDSHEGFKSIEDLALVPGLGKNFVKNHQDDLKKKFVIKK